MVPDATNVVMLRSGPATREVRARAALYEMVAEVDDALVAVCDGDIDSIFRAHILIGRAVALVFDNGLHTTSWSRSPGA